MKILHKLGICMDHTSAHIIEFTVETKETTTLESRFTHSIKEDTLKKSEILMHNKEQHLQADYYERLANIIKKYDEVVLFGPTNAKVEMFNILKLDRHFEKIKINVINTDKMTENQEHAFVKDYFSKQ